MASYLMPPAGIRKLTDDKVSNLMTWSEDQSPRKKHSEQKTTYKQKAIEPIILPPLNVEFDPTLPKRPVYPQFAEFDCPSHPYCVGIPTYQCRDIPSNIRQPPPKDDPCKLPYGLPPLSADVRRRAGPEQFWQEEVGKTNGAFSNWLKMYGEKYYYTKALHPPKLKVKDDFSFS